MISIFFYKICLALFSEMVSLTEYIENLSAKKDEIVHTMEKLV